MEEKMVTITANELKTKGIGCLQNGAIITQRGKDLFFVLCVDEYEAFEEYRLEQAYQQVKKDIKEGRTISKEKHLTDIENV
jgi:hypothetical protein